MGRRSRVAGVGLLCGAALLSACRRAPDAQQVAQRTAQADAGTAAAVESIYDAQGHLKTSSERVEWLEIPLGFRRKAQSYGRHILFEATGVPLDRARDFFGPRMFTGQVDEGDQRVFYRAVMPISADPRAVRLNLELASRSFDNTLLLDIERLTYDGALPLSVEEARKALVQERSRAE